MDGWLYLEKAVKLNLKHVRPHRSQVDAVMVRQAHAKGIMVIAYFANEEAICVRWWNCGWMES